MRVLRVLILYLFVGHAFADINCPHENGIYCPQIEAPRVTELKEGVVEIKYYVLPNGSVSNIEVIESSGDPRWVQAVTATVRSWKYRESAKKYRQEFKFSAVLGP